MSRLLGAVLCCHCSEKHTEITPWSLFGRSRMNVPFTINGGDEALEKKFLDEAKKHKLFTLAGHRSVGGCRASLYNGMPLEGVEKLTDFMKSFMDENRK